MSEADKLAQNINPDAAVKEMPVLKILAIITVVMLVLAVAAFLFNRYYRAAAQGAGNEEAGSVYGAESTGSTPVYFGMKVPHLDHT
jgi:hypothetical protein